MKKRDRALGVSAPTGERSEQVVVRDETHVHNFQPVAVVEGYNLLLAVVVLDRPGAVGRKDCNDEKGAGREKAGIETGRGEARGEAKGDGVQRQARTRAHNLAHAPM